jgi:hypothetical protein
VNAVANRNYIKAKVALTAEECRASAVEGDRLLAAGDAKGELLVMQSILGVRIQRTPNEYGYSPMMARAMMLQRAAEGSP